MFGLSGQIWHLLLLLYQRGPSSSFDVKIKMNEENQILYEREKDPYSDLLNSNNSVVKKVLVCLQQIHILYCFI